MTALLQITVNINVRTIDEDSNIVSFGRCKMLMHGLYMLWMYILCMHTYPTYLVDGLSPQPAFAL